MRYALGAKGDRSVIRTVLRRIESDEYVREKRFHARLARFAHNSVGQFSSRDQNTLAKSSQLLTSIVDRDFRPSALGDVRARNDFRKLRHGSSLKMREYFPGSRINGRKRVAENGRDRHIRDSNRF